MKTLFLIKQNHSLYPPIGGASLRNWQNINVMLKFGPVGVFFVANDVEQNIEVPSGLAMWNVQHVFERKLSLTEKLSQILQQFKSLLTRGHPFTNTSSICSPKMIEELERTLETFKPDIVIFSQIFLGSYLPIIQKYPCKLILDAHNAETQLFRENIKIKPVDGLKAKLKTSIEIIKSEIIERELVRDTDQVWICGEQDIITLQKLTRKPIKSFVIPNGVNTEYYKNLQELLLNLPEGLRLSPWNLLFPAIFDYEPNFQAAHLLIDEIYPRLKKHYPECQLLLIGSKPTEYMLSMAKKDPSIIVSGRVPDMRPYFAAASTVIVPLLQGSGTRLKILEAFASGRPVVSTSKGCEGIEAIDGEHLLIGDTTDALVDNVNKIWSDRELSEKISQSAFKLFEQRYSWEAVSINVGDAIKDLNL